MASPQRLSKSGFTLIELLVVLAIIAILTALVTPMLKKARDSANRISCANNMRQIGVAFQLYAGENNQSFPDYRWDISLDQYLSKAGQPKRFAVCPSAPTVMPDGPFAGAPLQCHYAYVGVYYNNPSFYAIYNNPHHVNVPAIQNPASKVMLLEDWNPPNKLGQRWGSTPLSIRCKRVHDTGSNFLFADGHVEWLNLGRGAFGESLNPITKGALQATQLYPTGSGYGAN